MTSSFSRHRGAQPPADAIQQGNAHMSTIMHHGLYPIGRHSCARFSCISVPLRHANGTHNARLYLRVQDN